MKFLDKTKERFEKINSVLCMGLDPVWDNLPEEVKSDDVEKTLTSFFYSLLDNFADKVLVVKPNIAFFEPFGIAGHTALKNIISYAQKKEIPVILDAKRADIGNTSKAYAKAVFEELNADAVTLAPYMGTDSLSPFFQYKDKGFFVLARTSNPGSSDFQMLKLENGQYLYEAVINKLIDWSKDFETPIGAVAGATHLEELDRIIAMFKNAGNLPLLIPGVGKQGGNLDEVLATLKKHDFDLSRVFINSSSKILYAHKEHGGLSYLEASEIEVNKMMLK
ncbi:MAG: orotidine-5'-phosphate decarboxylase [Spirochaetales bacterium]|nr:orotidine-5'-phosphate decarboxylase [Spirochaetales bacterium]